MHPGELGDHEGLAAVAFEMLVRAKGIADNIGTSAREKAGGAEIKAILERGDAGRIERRSQAVLRQRVADPGHALALDAITVREIAVGGQIGRWSCRERGWQ